LPASAFLVLLDSWTLIEESSAKQLAQAVFQRSCVVGPEGDGAVAEGDAAVSPFEQMIERIGVFESGGDADRCIVALRSSVRFIGRGIE